MPAVLLRHIPSGTAALNTAEPSSHSRAGADRPGGQSPCLGLWEIQIQFSSPVEFKAILPQKCSNFYLEASLGRSTNNWRALCRLERAQAHVLQSMQGCLDFQGKQKNEYQANQTSGLVGLNSDAHPQTSGPI